MCVRLVRRELGLFVGDLVAFDALVTGALSDFDLDVGFLRSEGRDVFPGLEGVFLPWSWFVGGHPRLSDIVIMPSK